jgi:hypothetical protein
MGAPLICYYRRTMTTLHDPAYRESIKKRLRSITADTPRRWGVMTADQMMWHLAEGADWYFGEMDVTGLKAPPMPKAVFKFVVLNFPWPKGATTMAPLKAAGRYDLAAERERCFASMEKFAAHSMEGEWQVHPLFGKMTGRECSRLQAKHFEHHLRQFGV